jgi:hypothetical protein
MITYGVVSARNCHEDCGLLTLKFNHFFLIIIYNYIDELINYFSRYGSIPHHNPLYVMSISTISHVIIHPTIYLCLQLIFYD